MNEKRRLARVRWVKDSSLEEATPVENNPTPWPVFPAGNMPQQGAVSEEESYAAHEEEVFGEENVSYDYEPLAEDGVDEDIWLEDGEFLEEEQDFTQEEDVKHPLSSALLILVALYIICGLAPLFVALFVSLRIFFWLEIGGWVIILAWLIIGVRPPLMIWVKERKKRASEQLLG